MPEQSEIRNPKFEIGDFPEWIEVFAAGTWTDAAGNAKEWTLEDLNEIASSYDPKTYPAPIVVGHPASDSPAYGWIEALKVEGEKLLAKPRELIGEFKEWIKRGIYKKISISLFPDMTLRHIGFLGGAAPAVKGLKPVEFAGKRAGWNFETEITFMDQFQQETVRSLFQRLRDWIIDKFGLEEADKVINPYAIDDLKPTMQKDTNPVAAGFSLRTDETDNVGRATRYESIPTVPASSDTSNKGGTHMDLGKLFTDLKALIVGAEKELAPADTTGAKFTEAEVQAREAKAKKDAETIAFAETEKLRKGKEESDRRLKDIETKARKDEIHAFCEGLAKEGKLIPAWQKAGIEEFLFNLDPASPVQFAEGDANKKTPSQWFKDFLTELPKVINFSEVAQSDGLVGATASEKLTDLTRKKMEEKKNLSYSQAFAEVQKENIELAKEALAEIRPSQK